MNDDVSRKFDRFILIRLEILCHLFGFYDGNVYIMPYSMVHFHRCSPGSTPDEGIQTEADSYTHSICCVRCSHRVTIQIELYLGN